MNTLLAAVEVVRLFVVSLAAAAVLLAIPWLVMHVIGKVVGSLKG